MTRTVALAAVLLAPAWGLAQDRPPDGVKNLGPALSPLQQTLSTKAEAAVGKTEAANKAKAEQDAAQQEVKKAEKRYNDAVREPPPPNATYEMLTAREARINQARADIQKQQTVVSQKTT